MKRRSRLAWLAALTLAVITASVGLWAAACRTPAGTGGGVVTPAARTVAVVRTDVAARALEAGTIGYAGSWRLANPGPGGVLTGVPSPGTVVSRGQPLYEVDGHAIRLLYGDRPVWRGFVLGMADGPDVRQLETNLVALGYASTLTVDENFDTATGTAINRWQAALGRPRTGGIPLGDVVFTPGPTRVSRVVATLGGRIDPDQIVLEATSTTPVITVNLPTVQQATVSLGMKVAVTPPTGGPQPGTIIAIGRVAQTTPQEPSGGPLQASITVTITLDNPGEMANLDQAPVQVAIITNQHEAVLAVPVTALVAAANGGYQVVVVEAGARRRITVRPGIFDEITNLIEVTGSDLAVGQLVEVPEP